MKTDDHLPQASSSAGLTPLPGDQQQTAPPALITNAGHAAHFAWEEFFYGAVRNPHTRRSYGRAVCRFLHWCEYRGLALHQIAPAHVGQFLDGLPDAPSSKKVYLAAKAFPWPTSKISPATLTLERRASMTAADGE